MKQLTPLVAAALALGCAVPAAAQTHRHHYYGQQHASAYVTGGITAVGGSLTSLRGAAGVVSLPLHHLNVVPGTRPQVSLEAPLDNNRGRYALTGELETRGNTFVGLGAGVGRLGVGGNTGMVYNVIAGTKVARNTALVGRFYLGSKSGMGTTGVLGVRFALP
jgi:hypothetical protein